MNLLLLNPEEVESGRATVSGRRARHAIDHLKIKPGVEIRAGILNGKIGSGLVTAVTAERIEIELTLTEDPPPPRAATLILALPRPKAFGRIIQAITSLGIKRVAICHSHQVEKAYWNAHQLNVEWVNHQITLGLEQAVDTLWPQVTFHRRLRPFVEDEVATLTHGHHCWIAHPAAAEKIPAGLSKPVALAIGPEGGWIPFELELFKSQGFHPGHFGAHLLKCETAVAAMIGHLLG